MKPDKMEATYASENPMICNTIIHCELITSWNFRPYKVFFDMHHDESNQMDSKVHDHHISNKFLQLRYTPVDSVERIINDIERYLDRPTSTVLHHFQFPIVQLKCDLAGSKNSIGLSFFVNLDNISYHDFISELRSSPLVIVKSKKDDLFFFYQEDADIDNVLKDAEITLYTRASNSLRLLNDYYFKKVAENNDLDFNRLQDDELLLFEMMKGIRSKLNNSIYKLSERDINSLCDICKKCKDSVIFKDFPGNGALCHTLMQS